MVLGRRTPAEAESNGERERAGRAYPARRCGECHETAVETWRQSAHARADTSPIYRAMREASERDDCDRCHAPLRGLVPKGDPVAREGVTCDVCHTLREVEPDPAGTKLDLEIGGATRYGSLCDLDDHYFHKMGCSELHATSQMCAGCHLWTTHTPTMPQLEVFTTFTDWKEGPYAEVDQPCQGCHMSGLDKEVAVGWTSNVPASDHGMFGPDDGLRKQAVSVELGVTESDGQLALELVVTNKGAGHPIPAGLPGRRLLVRASTVRADGDVLVRHERTYGKILVDADGNEVPFYAAHEIESDTRLKADDRRREQLSFPLAEVNEVRVEVFALALSPEIAKTLGVPAPEPERLVTARAIRAGRKGWETVEP